MTPNPLARCAPFARIAFDPDAHAYALDSQPLRAVTSVTSALKPPFDAPAVARRVAARDGHTVEAVLSEWEDRKVASQQRGDATHRYIAAQLSGASTADHPFAGVRALLSEMSAFDVWWLTAQREKARVVATETIVGDAALGVAGTLDALVWSDKTQHYHVLDWKTNSRFNTGNRWQRLLPPFDDLDDCELNIYSLQVSLYRLILDRAACLDGPLGDSYIIHLGRDGTPYTHTALDLRQRLAAFLESQKGA